MKMIKNKNESNDLLAAQTFTSFLPALGFSFHLHSSWWRRLLNELRDSLSHVLRLLWVCWYFRNCTSSLAHYSTMTDEIMDTSTLIGSNGSAGRRYDVRFLTKEEEYAVPSTVFQLNGSSTDSELNKLINAILQEGNNEWTNGEFDFILNGQLLRLSIEDHLEEIHAATGEFVSGEKELEVEYFSKKNAPTPFSSLLHDDWVSSVDANDKYIISGSYDGTVHVWTLSGKHKVAIPGHSSPVKVVRWINVHSFPGDAVTPPVNTNEYCFVSGSHDEVIHVWKWNSKSNEVDCVYVCRGHCRSVDCIDVNCDLFASGSFDKMLKIWSLEIDKEDTGSENDSSAKNKKKLKSNDREEVTNWNKTKVPLLTLAGHTEAITSLKWLSSKDTSNAAPELATCSMDNTIRIWDIELSEAKQTLVGSKAFLSISYSPTNNSIISGSCDRHIRLWDPRCSDGNMVKMTFSSHQAWVSSVAWSPTSDIHFISGSYDNVVKHWDIRSPKTSLYDLIGHKDKVLCVNWSHPEYMISGAADNQLKIFKTK